MGRFPHAVLHDYKQNGLASAIQYAKKFADMTNGEAAHYVDACRKTDGQPHLLDLYEVSE